MRSRPVPLAMLATLALAALGPAVASAQQYSRPSYYTPSNYGTPNASMYRPSSFGMPATSFGMPNPYRNLPNYGTLGPGTPTPVGVVHTLPGTLITGANYGAPFPANQPLTPDGGPITVNTPPPNAAGLGAFMTPEAQQAATPTPENAGYPTEVPGGTPTADMTAAGAYGAPAVTTFAPTALTTPSASVSLVAPYAAPSPSAAVYSTGFGLTPAAARAPAYGTFVPTPHYPASISNALNRVYGNQGY
jgi:hypothetical protein